MFLLKRRRSKIIKVAPTKDPIIAPLTQSFISFMLVKYFFVLSSSSVVELVVVLVLFVISVTLVLPSVIFPPSLVLLVLLF